MQNFIKSQTRLAFIQYIFQLEFLDNDSINTIEDFQNHFYNSNIAIIDDTKEFKLKFNKNFLNKLFNNYKNNFNINKNINNINIFNETSRKFEKWDKILISIVLAIISELNITDKKKIKIVFNDYLNISKSLVSKKETKLINAIINKYLDNYDFEKKTN